ncbi:MAG: hypothetical protein IPL40_11045 [Proteobacteria bacterium]|nr:hypothetical protein [Pseudomonadota bacterium]
MSLALTVLEPGKLSSAVSRVVGAETPAPARMMAARGLAPLGPLDLVTAIYQLGFDSDEAIASAARQTADKLPEAAVGAALAGAVDSRVIEFFALRVINKAALIERVLLNAQTDDQTFISLASKLSSDRQLEIIAANELRVLRSPAIIETLYFNRAARMSTVERLLELAVRNGLELAGIPQFKDIAANILGTATSEEEGKGELAADEGAKAGALLDAAAIDAIFATVVDGAIDGEALGELEFGQQEERERHAEDIGRLPVNAKIRKATLGTAFERAVLIRDPIRMVAEAAIRSPGVSENEAARYAANRNLAEDIIRLIAEKREWQRSYQIKVALVNNPKCPLAQAMRLLSHLRAGDLRAVARSKNVASVLATAAKRAAGGGA